MTTKLFVNTIAVATLGVLLGSPTFAQAQLKPAALLVQQSTAAPQIDSFRVNPVSQLSPGTELVFTLQGTPNAQAMLTIGTTARNLPMREVEPGYYEGRYTIRIQDQLTEQVDLKLVSDDRTD
ncbi:hypothetical protein K9N68_36590 (plasmid) [Kovacikia minuta CCNUW1]|uniref:hypothetical protein n=1 Tax=Kovacikia minuta TaxID=2931930 RepID=UPI001CCD2C87|nr:hypothetical protein [Kovacikia minuta]UBF30683.1 hypothetical protein K9N68_36590 [Kovacikia minuta CCNUW1]